MSRLSAPPPIFFKKNIRQGKKQRHLQSFLHLFNQSQQIRVTSNQSCATLMSDDSLLRPCALSFAHGDWLATGTKGLPIPHHDSRFLVCETTRLPPGRHFFWSPPVFFWPPWTAA